jgi:DNA-binding NarL/FixJ family response regulator
MSAPDRIRILTVDDHPLMQEGTAAMIKSQADMQLVAEAANSSEALEKFREHPL